MSKILKTCNNIRQSKSDVRSYRYLQLSNKIKCMLVSDMESKKSAATMQVQSGSLKDPLGVNGLAHFTEHMLFLGTEKYPEENHYSKFITSNGGSKNAATGEDYTYFYFDIKNDAFNEGLDIFSQFFKKPLFTESGTERELNAVDSEFKKNLSDYGRQLIQIEKSIIAKQGSVLNRFSTGNKETLQIDGIREKMQKFYQDNYSSNLMSLCLAGAYSLDDLEKMAVENFNDIVNKDIEQIDYSNEVTHSNENGLEHIYKIVPQKDIRSLTIKFPDLPPEAENWKTKPGHYISHLVGHEGPNSLLSELIKQGLATALSTSSTSRLQRQKLGLTISISLTEEGLKNYHKILYLLFAFINNAKKEGPKEYYLSELHKMNELEFDFQTRMNVMMSAKMNSQKLGRMHPSVPMEDFFWQDACYLDFSEELINKYLEKLTPRNAYYILTTKENEKLPNLKEEYYYKTKYTFEKVSNDLLNEWSNAKPMHGQKLGFCPPNPFMPKGVPQPLSCSEEAKKVTEPYQVQNVPDGNILWFKQDNQFDQPYVLVKSRIYTNDLGYPIDQKIFTFLTMWSQMLRETQRETTYLTKLSNQNFDFKFSQNVMQIDILAYNTGYQDFTALVLKEIMSFIPEKIVFENKKDATLRSYRNFFLAEPYQRQGQYADYLLCQNLVQLDRMIKDLTELTYEEFLETKKEWFQSLCFEWLIQGHLTEQSAIDLVDSCKKALDYKVFNQRDFLQSRCVKLQQSSVYSHKNVNQDKNVNSSIKCIFMYDMDSYKDNSIIKILHLLFKEQIFNKLRTQEQLGYIVQSNVDIKLRVLSFNIIIQSEKSPDHLEHRINNFLQERADWKPTQEDLDKQKAVVINALEQKITSLKDESSQNWTQIRDQKYDFEAKKNKIIAVQSITLDDIKKCFEQIFFGKCRRLNVKVYSETENQNDQTEWENLNKEFYDKHGIKIQEPATDFVKFQREHELYPINKL